MRPPRSAPTVLVAAAALVLGVGLGSAGSATAAGLTKGAVKKIAAQVVKKQASTLSVSHAATADRAERADQAASASTAVNLGGYSAANLTTTPTVFTISSLVNPAQQKEWALPQLAPGTYELGFNAAILPSLANASVVCGFANPTGPATGYGVTESTFVSSFQAAWPTTQTVHTVTVGEQVHFICSLTGGTFTIGPQGITITATLLNGSTTGSVTTVPRPADTAGLVGQ